MKKIIKFYAMLAGLFILFPCQSVSAMQPPADAIYQYSTPEDFIHWVNDETRSSTAKTHKDYVHAYIDLQNYIMVPRVTGMKLDGTFWGKKDVTLNYRFTNANKSIRIYVLPLNVCPKEYYSQDIVTLVEKRESVIYGEDITLEQVRQYSDIDYYTHKQYQMTESYQKTKLQIGNEKVTGIQKIQSKLISGVTSQFVSFQFIVSGLFVRVEGECNAGVQDVINAIKHCSFEKNYTAPQLEHNKKKNKVTKKNAILYATMYNPNNRKITDIKLYFYDKKAKKYKLQYSKKVSAESRAKKKLSINLNVNSCLKKGKKQLKRKQAMKLKRKTKYRYMIRVRMSGKYPVADKTSPNRQYYDVRGSFKLK